MDEQNEKNIFIKRMVLDVLNAYVYPPFNNGPIIPPIIDESAGHVEVYCAGLQVPRDLSSFSLAKITFFIYAIFLTVSNIKKGELHNTSFILWVK
ncbi:MAG: hypothetical protein QW265_05075 [Candidatus Bathyarchaeia archaeon]